jgi:hypothetical protein
VSVSTQEIGLEGLDRLVGVDALCLFIGEDDRPLGGVAGFVDWRLCGALSRVLKDRFFTGAQGDWLLLPSNGRLPPGRIFVVGLGQRDRLGAQGLAQVLAHAAQTLSRAQVASVALEIPGEGQLEEQVRAQAFSERFLPTFRRAEVAVLAPRSLGRMLADH